MAAKRQEISSSCCNLATFKKIQPHIPVSKNVYIVLIWILLTHAIYNYTIFNVGGTLSLGKSDNLPIYVIGLTQIIVLMLYPVAGIIGEVYWTRYKVIIIGTILMLLSLILAPFSFVGLMYYVKDDQKRDKIGSILLAVALIPFQIGLAIFQSNIIQFGTDQLLFAPTGQLSNFVHWSFWCMYLFPVIIVLIFSPFEISPLTAAPLVQLITLIIALVSMLLPCIKKHLEILQKNRINPIKQVCGVIKYARNNKYPQNPSAFIYNDEECHNRINFAKKRYGGPYTTEEVEDVKTFGRITILFLSLFGFLFIDNTGMLFRQYDYQETNSSYTRIEIASHYFIEYFTPSFIIIIIGVPVYKLILCPFFYKYLPTMIKRMGIGLVCVFVSLLLQFVISYLQYSDLQEIGVCGRNISITAELSYELNITHSTMFVSQYTLIAPQVLNGFALLLTFLTALEFILAQSPRSMQGLLIGFWYAIQSLNVMLSTFFFTTDIGCSYISYIVRLIPVGLSLCLYSLTAYWYKGRKRQELSNIKQNMIIEDYTTRNLKQNNDQHTQENYDLTDFSIKSLK